MTTEAQKILMWAGIIGLFFIEKIFSVGEVVARHARANWWVTEPLNFADTLCWVSAICFALRIGALKQK